MRVSLIITRCIKVTENVITYSSSSQKIDTLCCFLRNDIHYAYTNLFCGKPFLYKATTAAPPSPILCWRATLAP